jgi:para-aminobenzoate synthetase component 1
MCPAALHPPHAREIVPHDPAEMAARLRGERHLLFLDSAMRQEHVGRYSFLACNPAQTLMVRGGATFLDDAPVAEAAPAVLDRLLAQGHAPPLPGLPPFQGGFAGYIAYDYGAVLEPSLSLPRRALPELMLNRYDTVMAWDHLQERAWIISRGGATAIDALAEKLKTRPPAPGRATLAGFASNFTREAYEDAIARTVDHVLAGDIFQANIAQQFSATVDAGFDAFAFHEQLRRRNAAPFAAFLDFGEVVVASASPERLVSVRGGVAEARPIKGTRRRDANPARDATLVAELMASRKDRAENVMIVDLLRNDLSRVAEPGTVTVPMLCGLESYAGVHHLTSVVTARVRADVGAGGLLAALFPGGSITGAPKIRAMAVIAEMERRPRGIYCGSIGYASFPGAADFNIAIRTVEFSDGQARFSGGGGITARSSPAEEYDETLTKVARIEKAFQP